MAARVEDRVEDVPAPAISDDTVAGERLGERAADVALVEGAAVVRAASVDLALQLVDACPQALPLVCVLRPSCCFDVGRDFSAELALGAGLRSKDTFPRPLVEQRLSARGADAHRMCAVTHGLVPSVVGEANRRRARD